MAKESTAGMTCRCGIPIYYAEQHYPHCPERSTYTLKKKREEGGKGGRR